jgi:hypothetical protein
MCSIQSIQAKGHVSLGHHYFVVYPDKEYIVEEFPGTEVFVEDKYESMVFNIKDHNNTDLPISMKILSKFVKCVTFINFSVRISNIMFPESIEEVKIIGNVDRSLFDFIKSIKNIRVSIYVNCCSWDVICSVFNDPLSESEEVGPSKNLLNLDLTSFNAKKLKVLLENDGNFGSIKIKIPEGLEEFKLSNYAGVPSPVYLPVLYIPKSLFRLKLKTSQYVHIINLEALKNVKELYLKGLFAFSLPLMQELANTEMDLELLHIRTVLFPNISKAINPLIQKAKDLKLEFMMFKNQEIRSSKLDPLPKPFSFYPTLELSVPTTLRKLFVKSMYSKISILINECPIFADVKFNGMLKKMDVIESWSEVRDIILRP